MSSRNNKDDNDEDAGGIIGQAKGLTSCSSRVISICDRLTNAWSNSILSGSPLLRNIPEKGDGEPGGIYYEKDFVLRIRILKADKLRDDPFITHPVVRVHLVDVHTGQYLQKPDYKIPIVSKYEGQTVYNEGARNVPKARSNHHITPQLSVPTERLHASSLLPVWNYDMIINVSYRKLLKQNTLLLFELLDFSPTIPEKFVKNASGFYEIAWGYLSPVNEQKQSIFSLSPHAEKRTIRMQLYDYYNFKSSCCGLWSPARAWARNNLDFIHSNDAEIAAQGVVPKVYLQFCLNKNYQTRYPSTLHLVVDAVPKPEKLKKKQKKGNQESTKESTSMPHLWGHPKGYELREVFTPNRPSVPWQVEKASINASAGNDSLSRSPTKQNDESEENEKVRHKVRRRREANQPCAVPDTFFHRISVGAFGCTRLEFSNSGDYLAAGCKKSQGAADGPFTYPLIIFNTDTGDMLLDSELDGHQGSIHDIAWRADDKEIATASSDGTIRIWHIYTISAKRQARCRLILNYHVTSYVYTIAFRKRKSDFAKNGLPLVSGGSDGLLRIWDISENASDDFDDNYDTVSNTNDEENTIEEADFESELRYKGCIGEKEHEGDAITAARWTYSGSKLVTGDAGGRVCIWRRKGTNSAKITDMCDVRNYRLLRIFKSPSTAGSVSVTSLYCQGANPSSVLVQYTQNHLQYYNLKDFTSAVFSGSLCSNRMIRSVVSPDGTYILSGSEEGKPLVWSAITGKKLSIPLSSFQFPAALCDVAWHPREHLVALGAYGENSPITLVVAEPDVAPPELHADITTGARFKFSSTLSKTLGRSTRLGQDLSNTLEETMEEKTAAQHLKETNRRFTVVKDSIRKRLVSQCISYGQRYRFVRERASINLRQCSSFSTAKVPSPLRELSQSQWSQMVAFEEEQNSSTNTEANTLFAAFSIEFLKYGIKSMPFLISCLEEDPRHLSATLLIAILYLYVGTGPSNTNASLYINHATHLIDNRHCVPSARENALLHFAIAWNQHRLETCISPLQNHLAQYPQDFLIARLINDKLFWQGKFAENIPMLQTTMKACNGLPELVGYYAFALEQAGECYRQGATEEAEKISRSVLRDYPKHRNPWATHALIHCMDTKKQNEEIIVFAEKDLKLYQDQSNTYVSTHLGFHKGVAHLDLNQFDEAFRVTRDLIFDQLVITEQENETKAFLNDRKKGDNKSIKINWTSHDIVNAIALLGRFQQKLRVSGGDKQDTYDLGELWQKLMRVLLCPILPSGPLVSSIATPPMSTVQNEGFSLLDQTARHLAFLDLHYLLCLRENDTDLCATFALSLKQEYPNLGPFIDVLINSKANLDELQCILLKKRSTNYDGLNLNRALHWFLRENIGGSNAQREIFEQEFLLKTNNNSFQDPRLWWGKK
eukprot:g3155.t1